MIKDRVTPKNYVDFWQNWPRDLVCIINGRPVWKSAILKNKQIRQQRQLEYKRRITTPIQVPCFIWTFYNDSWVYGGWWLYVRTLKKDYQIKCRSNRDTGLALKIANLFPCGLEPTVENLTDWKAAFAEKYHYPTIKRPERNGLVIDTAVIDPTMNLIDVLKRTV